MGGREQTPEEGRRAGLVGSQSRPHGQLGQLGAEKEAEDSWLVISSCGLYSSKSQQGHFPLLGAGQAGMDRGAGGVLEPSGHSLPHQSCRIELGQVVTHRSKPDPWADCLVILSFIQQTFTEHLLCTQNCPECQRY